MNAPTGQVSVDANGTSPLATPQEAAHLNQDPSASIMAPKRPRSCESDQDKHNNDAGKGHDSGPLKKQKPGVQDESSDAEGPADVDMTMSSDSESHTRPQVDDTPKVAGTWNTWNKGVTSGALRIGFSGDSDSPVADRPQAPDPSLQSIQSRMVARAGKQWILPPLSDKTQGSWDDRVESWADEFVENNGPAITKLRHPDFTALAHGCADLDLSKNQKRQWRTAVTKFIRTGKWTGLVSRVKATRSRASATPQPAEPNSPQQDEAMVSPPAPDGSGAEGGQGGQHVPVVDLCSPEQSRQGAALVNSDVVVISSDESDEESLSRKSQRSDKEESRVSSDGFSEEAIMQTLRGDYPGVADSEICVFCQLVGHDGESCPFRTCEWCGKRNAHSRLGCPLRWRCTRCSRLGHDETECDADDVLPASDRRCRHCDGLHGDVECDRLWRTHYPREDSMPKIKYLPMQCYRCCGHGHLGPECRKNPVPGGSHPAAIALTMAHRVMYVDPNSERTAIEYPDGPQETAQVGQAPPTHRPKYIEYTDDDDSDEGFLPAPRVPYQPPPQSRGFTSFLGRAVTTRGRGGGQGRGRGRGSGGRGRGGGARWDERKPAVHQR